MTERKDRYGYGVTIPPITARLVDAGVAISEEEPDELRFLHAVLCQVGFPRRKQDELTFERRSGHASVLLEAGKLWDGTNWQQQQLPYGTRPRLAMIHVCSEAVRNNSATVDLGKSLHAFLKGIGVYTTGRGYADFRRQIKYLAACRLMLGMAYDNKAVTVDAKPFSRFAAWLDNTGNQPGLWPAELTLSNEFYETLREHAVPLDNRAVAALTHSALALDIYTWLAHRLCRVRKQDGVKLSWRNLRYQFGQEYADSKNFKREYRKALRAVLAVYPSARLEDTVGGIILKPSPPPVPKPRVVVRGA